MGTIDSVAWKLIRVCGLIQGKLASLLMPYAHDLQSKVKVIQWTESGLYLWNSTPDSVPEAVYRKLIVEGRILLVVLVYDVIRTVLDLIVESGG
ncbi:hypothetical protein LCGC14_1837510 [marine sediment metagenome]|uniref:Uncharacterized protein n=1 Tax=marine sediment metagenome TaxID=412755 RepID=A0A0F9GEE0_9ZZZZ